MIKLFFLNQRKTDFCIMITNNWISRTALLIEPSQMASLTKAHVLIVGLGGVGGICAEMICRAGVGTMTIVDSDTVDESNRNRQIISLLSTNGKSKASVLKERLLDINPELNINIIIEFVGKEKIDALFTNHTFNFVCDCIDTLTPKTELILKCLELKIPIVSSMGAGGKLDPSQAAVADISETYNCNLARYVRKRLQKNGIKKGFMCVYSTELADQSKIFTSENAFPKKSIIGTISYMPNIFGCLCASVAIRKIIEKN